MKVVIYARSTNFGTKLNQYGAMLAGMKRHGLNPIVREITRTERCDLAVVWGTRRKMCNVSGDRMLVMERGYIGDRFYWTSVGFGGLNGKADFNLRPGMPADRARKFEHLLQPWRPPGDKGKVLLIGQVPGDMSLRGVIIQRWYMDKIAQLRRIGYKVRFRPHPSAPLVQIPVYGMEVSPPGRELADDMAECDWVVTYNSNSGVEAALAGVPVSAEGSGTMAWPIASRSAVQPGFDTDRSAWFNSLSYTQWSLDEIASGETWEHLKSGLGREHVSYNDLFASGPVQQATSFGGSGRYEPQKSRQIR